MFWSRSFFILLSEASYNEGQILISEGNFRYEGEKKGVYEVCKKCELKKKKKERWATLLTLSPKLCNDYRPHT